jgi:hypothetical protein
MSIVDWSCSDGHMSGETRWRRNRWSRQKRSSVGLYRVRHMSGETRWRWYHWSRQKRSSVGLCRVRATRLRKFSLFSSEWGSGGSRGRVAKVGGVDAKRAPSAKHTASRTSWLHTCKESQDVSVNFSWKLTKDKVVRYQSLELAGWYQTVPYLRPQSRMRWHTAM